MVTTKFVITTAATVFALLATAQAQNPGECPQDDGKYRSTSRGYFKITCNKKAARGIISSEPQPSFAACIDAAAAKTNCLGVDYNVDTKSCSYLNGAFVPALASAGNPTIHNARKADPPAQPPPVVPAPQPPVDPSPQLPINPAPQPPVDPAPQPPVDPAPQPPVDPQPQDPSKNPNQDITITDDPQCPGDDGRAYVASDGTFYKLQGPAHGKSQTPLSTGSANTYAECMEQCSKMNGCNSIQWTARYVAGTPDTQFLCRLYTDEGETENKCDNYDQHCYAYAIDPPTHDEKDFPNQLCTTVCPAADGMTYTTSYAETFKMDCGKRHGTTILSWGYVDTFEACMENCGALVACHSVDYQERTRKCYYGTHHGNPLITAPGYQSAHSVGCAGACSSCCGCQGSEKKQSAADQPPPDTPDISCGNQGFEYAIYPNKRSDGTQMTMSDNTYSTYDVQPFKTAKPEAIGKTKSIGFNGAQSIIYDYTRQTMEYVTVNHRSYLYTKQAGEYTFSIPGGDDLTFLWVGPTAYSGFTRANANARRSYSEPPVSYKATFQKGEYVPLRIIWANGGGPGTLMFEIKAPDGTVIIGADTITASPFLVQFSCDRTTAPKFPPYGSES